jgi:hypothetical protein
MANADQAKGTPVIGTLPVDFPSSSATHELLRTSQSHLGVSNSSLFAIEWHLKRPIYFLQQFSFKQRHHALLFLRPACLDDNGGIRRLPFFACFAGHDVLWCHCSCPAQRTTSIRYLERIGKQQATRTRQSYLQSSIRSSSIIRLWSSSLPRAMNHPPALTMAPNGSI